MTFLRTVARALSSLKTIWKSLGKTKIGAAVIALILVITVFPDLVFSYGKTFKLTNAPAAGAPMPHPTPLVPIVGHAVGFAETLPVRDLTAGVGLVDAGLQFAARKITKLNMGDFGIPNPNASPQKDGTLQFPWGQIPRTPKIPAPLLTFEGIPANGSAPPDTTGAIGPNDYVQAVNTLIRIFDKNGNPRGPAFKLSTLFAPLGGVVASTDNGAAIVLYDRIADRWLLSQFAFTSTTTPPYHEAIAISKTGDPTGAYWIYDFVVPGNEFPDNSKFGVWPDAYYMTDRQFTNGVTYNGFGCFAFDRAAMLVGDPTATFIYFNAGSLLSSASSAMCPSDFFGCCGPPPDGSPPPVLTAPNVFSVFADDAFAGDVSDALRLYNFHADFAVPANSTFLERPESPLPVAAFDSRNPSGPADIEQPPPATAADRVDTIGDRLMLRLQYLNNDGNEMLTTCHTVNAGIIPAPGVNPTAAEYKAGTRYYILQKTAGGAYSVLDQSTFSPDTTERWMGSTAVDNAGNLAVGYSISSTSVFPGIGYAGRLATDPPNTLSGEQVMVAGTGVQLGTGNRWGEYSNLSLDPTDNATFWYTNQYQGANGQSNWQTRIGSFKFASTTAPAQGTLAGTIIACDTGVAMPDALVQVTGGPSTGFSGTTNANGTYSFRISPASYTATIIDPAHNCTGTGPFNVVITDGTTTTLDGCLTGIPKFALGPAVVSGGNGDTTINRAECVLLNIPIRNIGCLAAAGVTATLSTTTPQVTISQPSSGYPTINENVTGTNTAPFVVSTSPTFACGTIINFTLTISSPSGGSIALPFSLLSCEVPPVTINGALMADDSQQPDGRMDRLAPGSSCGAAKACPGVSGTGPRLFDQHTFTNGPAPACVKIKTTPNCSPAANPIFTVAYLSSYDPSNLCNFYLADAGGSPPTEGNTFSVDVPAGATLVLVVQEINPGLSGCSGYSLDVSGLVTDSAGSGPCGGASPTPTPSPSPSGTATPTPTATVSPTPSTQVINLSTRMRVQAGDKVGIGGLIITGTAPKQVLLRAPGPSLIQFGVPGVLADPVLELHGPGSFVTIINNNWRDTQEVEIQATGIPPTNDFESAIVATLAPGAYTAIVRGNDNTSGVALIEVYDLDQAAASKLANISTRAFVSVGDDIVIAGFTLGGNNRGNDRIVVRGIGPSLTAFGVPNALANPTLELRDSNGALLISNNDWQDNPAQAAELTAAGLAPTNPLESGVAITLAPDLYTALFAGLNNGTGIGVVEVYDRGGP